MGLRPTRGSDGRAEPHEAPSAGLPPDQEIFPLNVACCLTGVKPATLRQWSRQACELEPAPASNGQLLLTRRQVALILRIRSLIGNVDLSLAKALRKAKMDREPEAPSPPSAHPVCTPREPSRTSGRGRHHAGPRPPWEDTEIRSLVQKRLEPIVSSL